MNTPDFETIIKIQLWLEERDTEYMEARATGDLATMARILQAHYDLEDAV